MLTDYGSRVASLGVLLKLLRDESGLTQEELANRSGLSARSVSDIERGLRRRLYTDTAHRLADALSLSGAQRDGFVAAARGRAMPRPDPPALPLPLNRLVGRVDELASLSDALSPGNRRLVTITSPLLRVGWREHLQAECIEGCGWSDGARPKSSRQPRRWPRALRPQLLLPR